MVPGGSLNSAQGNYSFAAGLRAKASAHGSFVWADSQDADFASTADNEFSVRATGGVRLISAIDGSIPAAGVALAPGSGSWSMLSDRNAKENFTPADGREILDKVSALSLASWNYRTQDKAIRHIGPTAQEFRAAFGVGEDDRTITTVDASGVALAAIQGLNQKLEEKLHQQEAEIAALRQAVKELQSLLKREAAQEGVLLQNRSKLSKDFLLEGVTTDWP
jgi:hypothetical protein